MLQRTDRCWLGIVSAPLWDSKTSTFAGLLTSTDFINVIQYYMQFPEKFEDVEKFRLSSLRGMQATPPSFLVLAAVLTDSSPS